MLIHELENSEKAENLLVNCINEIHQKGPISLELLEKLSYIKEFYPEVFAIHEKQLVYILGLFFKTSEPTTLLQSVYKIYSDSIESITGRKFTPVQASMYQRILENKYYSFSSPTSSGKSHLFRELITEEKGDIVIIVPSRALIAEYLFTVKDILKSEKSVLILQFAEDINRLNTQKRIYILTPERAYELFKIHKQLNIKLFLFDEAQISEEEIRGLRFDALVRRADKLIPDAKKVFAHPFVLNPDAQLKKHNFSISANSNNFRQLTVGKIYLAHSNGAFSYFSPFARKKNRNYTDSKKDIIENLIVDGGTVLIYVAKAAIYKKEYLYTFEKYINLCDRITHPEAIQIIDELRLFIGASNNLSDKYSILIDLMHRGIVIHHGSIPLYARLLIEKFVNLNHAKICFSTSTLIQGINMPFDLVWIDNYRFDGNTDKKNLDLKNLIGRAGRTRSSKDKFDYGFVVIEEENVDSFCSRVKKESTLTSESKLEHDLDNLHEDQIDIAEAIKNETFNDELNLTQSQVERIEKGNNDNNITIILDNLFIENRPIKASEYSSLRPKIKNQIKQSFREIFISHLRRKELNPGEMGALSTSIPILLWRIQGKSFNEIVSLRHSYVTQKSKRLAIEKRLKTGEINIDMYAKEISNVELKYSVQATSLPNYRAKKIPLFPIKSSLSEFQYDLLVYDTYDYLDKVLAQSLADPLYATFTIFYRKTKDIRALSLANFIKYGTNDDLEIWLLKYGFGFEEIEWLVPLIEHIDENQIIFNDNIKKLDSKKYEIIERYIP